MVPKEYLNETTGVLICRLDGSDVLIEHNIYKAFSSASVIKLFVLSYYLYNKCDLNRRFTIKPEDRIDSSIITEIGMTEATLYELLVYMSCSSDNTATNLLMADAGFDKLNDYCENVLGTKQTRVCRMMLDFDSRQKGIDNMTSAADVLTVMRSLTQIPEAKEIMSKHKCRDRIMRYIYKQIQYYGKAGDLDDVYNDVAVLERPDGSLYYAAVLTNGLEKPKARNLCGAAGLIAYGADRPVV